MRLKIIILFFVLFPILGLSQNSYYENDSSAFIGVKLIDSDDIINCKICQVKQGNSILRFTPSEIKEYGFKDGRVFVSKKISISGSTKKVFLQKLESGDITLFYYKEKDFKTFFISIDDTTLLEIPKYKLDNTFKSQLFQLTKGKPDIRKNLKYVDYSKRSMSKYISRYNNNNSRYFPHFRYGVSIGYNPIKLYIVDEADIDIMNFKFDYIPSYDISVFIDQPISISNLSIFSGLSFSKHAFSYHEFNNFREVDLDLVANITSLNIPINLKFTLPLRNYHFYLKAGPSGLFNLRNNSNLYVTSFDDNIIEINETDESNLINDFLLGYSFGGGFMYNTNSQFGIFLDITYDDFWTSNKPLTVGINGISIRSGILF
ncbi:hypothetical protein ACE01N_00550 [Saccharicrinis sp. FJH2]|uniref:hypothetical protein n=1 Tax=Saccharicrinis sp. FJH65 TaxID=3344659 RepID=UPI0035F4531F